MMDWDSCAGCGQIEIESVHPCVFCGDAAKFCSPTCCWDNYEEHLGDGCRVYEEQRDAIRDRVQATPHSVFDAAVFARISRNRELCKRLYLKFHIGELCSGRGCLVLRAQDELELCTLLNNARDPIAMIEKMSVFETCVTLMKKKKESVISDVRMVMCSTDPLLCNRFLYCVLSGKGTKLLTRIFSVHPLARPPALE